MSLSNPTSIYMWAFMHNVGFVLKPFGITCWLGTHVGLGTCLAWRTCWLGAHVGLVHMLAWCTCWLGAHVGLAHVCLLHMLGCCTCWVAAHVGLLHMLGCCTCWLAKHVGLLHMLGCCTCWVAAHVGLFVVTVGTLQPHYNTLLYIAHLLITPYRLGSHCLYFLCIGRSF